MHRYSLFSSIGQWRYKHRRSPEQFADVEPSCSLAQGLGTKACLLLRSQTMPTTQLLSTLPSSRLFGHKSCTGSQSYSYCCPPRSSFKTWCVLTNYPILSTKISGRYIHGEGIRPAFGSLLVGGRSSQPSWADFQAGLWGEMRSLYK